MVYSTCGDPSFETEPRNVLVFRVIASVAGVRIVSSAIQAVTLVLLIRLLGASSFGSFAAVSTSVSVLVVFIGFGSSSLALRVSALEDQFDVATTIALIRIPVALASGLIASAVALFLLGIDSLHLILVAALYGAAESLGEGIESILYGCNRVWRAQISMLARRIVVVFGVGIASLSGSPLTWLGFILLLVAVFAGIPLWGILSRPAGMGRVFRLAAPLWLPTLLAKAQTLDVVIASLVMPSVSSGVYAAGARVTSPLNTVAAATLSVLTPRLSSRFDASGSANLFIRSRKIMFVVCVCLVLVSPVVGAATSFVVGPSYSGVFLVALLLTCMTAVAAMTQIYVSLFYSRGNGHFVLRARLLSVVPALGIGAVVGMMLGPIALALAMVCSQLFLWFLLHRFSKNLFEA